MDSTTRTYRREETTSRSVGLGAWSCAIFGKAFGRSSHQKYWIHVLYIHIYISNHIYMLLGVSLVSWCPSYKTNVCFCRNLWQSPLFAGLGYKNAEHFDVGNSGQLIQVEKVTCLGNNRSLVTEAERRRKLGNHGPNRSPQKWTVRALRADMCVPPELSAIDGTKQLFRIRWFHGQTPKETSWRHGNMKTIGLYFIREKNM